MGYVVPATSPRDDGIFHVDEVVVDSPQACILNAVRCCPLDGHVREQKGLHARRRRSRCQPVRWQRRHSATHVRHFDQFRARGFDDFIGKTAATCGRQDEIPEEAYLSLQRDAPRSNTRPRLLGGNQRAVRAFRFQSRPSHVHAVPAGPRGGTSHDPALYTCSHARPAGTSSRSSRARARPRPPRRADETA
jgi:hypothetical protein